jgi:hypothetical protein
MWLDVTNRNPHWSYIEFVSKYPEADQLADARERDWLTAGEFEIMSGFGLKLSAHTAPGGDGYDNAAILDDPAWHAVIAAAQLARQELVSFVTDQSEREILLATSSR